MKKLLLAFSLLLAATTFAAAQNYSGPANPILCNKTATFSGISAITQLVAPVANARIAICGWHVTNTSATSYSFTLTFGTQTTNPCDTSTFAFTPALSVTNAAPSSDHIDFAVVASNLSMGLCVTPSNVALTGLIYYSQF